jgi:hypothetical protein
MKGCKHSDRGIGAAALVAVAIAAAALPAQATVYTIADGTSQVLVDPTSSAGLFSWTINGVNQLAQQWYWFRIGPAGGESAVSSLSAPVVTQAYGAGGRELTAVYSNTQLGLGIKLSYSLSGGLNSGGLNESISINNLTGSPLDIHFFRYADLDLNGAPGGQSVAIQTSGGLPYKAIQTLPGIGSATTTLISSPNSAEAAFFNSTLVSLNDGNPTSFAGGSLTAGPGDVTHAFEWDYSIAANSSKLISVIQSVPEPSSLALLVSGAALWALRRRQNG